MSSDSDIISSDAEIIVPPDLDGERLDICIVKLLPELSRTRVQTLIKEECVFVDGTPQNSPKYKVPASAKIVIHIPEQENKERAEAEDIPLEVVYEDDDILVINKSAGMVVHPAAGNWKGTVVNALLGRDPDLFDEKLDPLRPGIVHRLDKDTSGCLVIAKTPKSHRKLSKAFADRTVEKVYAAIVHGWPLPETGSIQTTMGRHPTDRKKMAVLRPGEGRDAYTTYKVLKKGYWGTQKVALLQVKIFTGRTHQIRVHMSYKDYPVLGDKLYSRGRASRAERQMLHAWKLTLNHPITQEELNFKCDFPDDFKRIVDSITPEKP